MRDAYRMKEKYDLSLDNRQIVSLVIAGIVVLGAVFVLGVVVGKKLSESEEAAGAPDLLTALDEKAAAMEKAQGDPALTFQEELTRKPSPEPGRPEVRVVSLPRPPEPVPSPPAAQPEPIAQEVEPAPPSPTSEQPPAAVGVKGTFTLQLMATQTREEAVRFVAKLKDRGYASYIVQVDLPGKGTWFRVRMGNFPTREAASGYLQDFKRETQLDAFVAASE